MEAGGRWDLTRRSKG